MNKSMSVTASYQTVDFMFTDESFESIFAENDYEMLYELEEMEENETETEPVDVIHYYTLLEGDDVLIDFNTSQHNAVDLKDVFDELEVEDDEDTRAAMIELSQQNEDTVLHINHPMATDFSITFLDTPSYALHVGHHDEIIVN